eukprot:693125-Prymnesium_polylepis.1
MSGGCQHTEADQRATSASAAKNAPADRPHLIFMSGRAEPPGELLQPARSSGVLAPPPADARTSGGNSGSNSKFAIIPRYSLPSSPQI